MPIKTSKTLVDEALKEIKTLKIEEVKELIDKKNMYLGGSKGYSRTI